MLKVGDRVTILNPVGMTPDCVGEVGIVFKLTGRASEANLFINVKLDDGRIVYALEEQEIELYINGVDRMISILSV
jgi:hypothetical protein